MTKIFKKYFDPNLQFLLNLFQIDIIFSSLALFDLLKTRMQKNKAIADRYKIQNNLFRVNSYLYAKIFDKFTLDTVIGCVYVYENQQPGQILKMLLEKFSTAYRMSNLIFPTFHVKDNLHDKSVSIFFMGQHLAPLQIFTETQYASIDVHQMLKFTYDAFCSLHFLHSHDIIHGNISLNTCYLSKNQKDTDFALNILDTSTFHQELLKSYESLLFRSQCQHNGLKTSYKDDAQCIIYILVNLISKGKMLSKQRYYQEWINQNQLLRWKSMDFYKQMVDILPPELQFLAEIFTIVKSLSRNQKPDYPKFIKKTYSMLKQKQTTDMISINKKMSGVFSMDSIPLFEKKPVNQDKKVLQKPISQYKRLSVKKPQQDQEDFLLKIDSDDQQIEMQKKFSKLQSTKCSAKASNFWHQSLQNPQ